MRHLNRVIQHAMNPLPHDIQRVIVAHVITFIRWFTQVKGNTLHVSANDILSYYNGTFEETAELLQLLPDLRICIYASIYDTVIDATTLESWLDGIPVSKVVFDYDAQWWNN